MGKNFFVLYLSLLLRHVPWSIIAVATFALPGDGIGQEEESASIVQLPVGVSAAQSDGLHDDRGRRAMPAGEASSSPSAFGER